MARATRIALDMALFSLKKIHPTVSSIWGTTKAYVEKTSAKPLVCNVVVTKVETALDRLVSMLISGVISLRNKQLPKEEKYLESELEKVKKRISSNNTNEQGKSSTSKAARPVLGCVWQYAKTEIVPPMTYGFFHGPAGKNIENTIASVADGFIASLQQNIKNIEQNEIRIKKEKEDAIKIAQEKAAAKAKEEKMKIVEEKRKQLAKSVKEKKDAKKVDAKQKEPIAEKKEIAKKVAAKPKEPIAAKKEIAKKVAAKPKEPKEPKAGKKEITKKEEKALPKPAKK